MALENNQDKVEQEIRRNTIIIDYPKANNQLSDEQHVVQGFVSKLKLTAAQFTGADIYKLNRDPNSSKFVAHLPNRRLKKTFFKAIKDNTPAQFYMNE